MNFNNMQQQQQQPLQQQMQQQRGQAPGGSMARGQPAAGGQFGQAGLTPQQQQVSWTHCHLGQGQRQGLANSVYDLALLQLDAWNVFDCER